MANIIRHGTGYTEDEGQEVHVSRRNYNFVHVTSQMSERPKDSPGFYQFIRIPLGVCINPLTPNDLYRCPRRNLPDFGRVFLRSKYTDITQNTYIQS